MNLLDAALAVHGTNRTVPADAPPVPTSIRETGLTPESVTALAIKILYVQGAMSGRKLSDRLRLSFEIVDDILLDLQQRHFAEVGGVRGHGRGSYVFDLTSAGRARAQEAMEGNVYVGPAPVTLETYSEWVQRQSVLGMAIEPEEIQACLSHLVLPGHVLRQLGPAVNSGRSLFLYGHAGNGKTEAATSIARMLKGRVYLPFAVEVEGRIIVLQDAVHHELSADENRDEDSFLSPIPGFDQRFAHVDRPVVFTGGELALDQLDLKYDAQAKFYRAPVQMKANGGVLIIDDLGRQMVRVDELLNRWMVPLERRMDYLTLHTGHSFPVPFDCLVVFSTNLEPSELVDEAFLRRIHYKIHMENPTREEYEEIFRRACEARGIAYDGAAVDRIFRDYYDGRHIPPRGCHPRDIVQHVCDLARYERREPSLDERSLDDSCRAYFLDER
ncbi:MAG TPA: ATP-binding protein [Gemmatimonadota bacterium]|nr:ATP-binding protein [Gemmatimonadota bacterium]